MELSKNFARLVEVLQAVADRVLASSSTQYDGNALRLYERWCETGSEQLASALAKLGMMPTTGGGGLH